MHYSPYDPHGGVHPGPLVTGMHTRTFFIAFLEQIFVVFLLGQKKICCLQMIFLPIDVTSTVSFVITRSSVQTMGFGTRSALCIRYSPSPTPTTWATSCKVQSNCSGCVYISFVVNLPRVGSIMILSCTYQLQYFRQMEYLPCTVHRSHLFNLCIHSFPLNRLAECLQGGWVAAELGITGLPQLHGRYLCRRGGGRCHC